MFKLTLLVVVPSGEGSTRFVVDKRGGGGEEEGGLGGMCVEFPVEANGRRRVGEGEEGRRGCGECGVWVLAPWSFFPMPPLLPIL